MSRIAYQCYATGEYLAPLECFDNLLPNGATWVTPPDPVEGFTRFFKDGKWTQVENHKGEEGYLNGERTIIKEFGPLPEGWSTTPPPPTEEELFEKLRSMRDSKLTSCDWTVLPDSPFSSEKKKEWKEYRQALRDITEQEGSPWDGGDSVPWPKEPE